MEHNLNSNGENGERLSFASLPWSCWFSSATRKIYRSYCISYLGHHSVPQFSQSLNSITNRSMRNSLSPFRKLFKSFRYMVRLFQSINNIYLVNDQQKNKMKRCFSADVKDFQGNKSWIVHCHSKDYFGWLGKRLLCSRWIVDKQYQHSVASHGTNTEISR